MSRHLAFITFVNFISNDNKRKMLGVLRVSIKNKVFSPFRQTVKAFVIGDIKYNNAAIGSPIELLA